MTELESAIVATVRRWGRRGINEATVWTVMRGQFPRLTVAESAAAVDRLITSGVLYRARRRTRTMLKVFQPAFDVATPESADAPEPLF